MLRTILRTVPLRDLVWSGNDKKTANVPVGDDFKFFPGQLPTFEEQWPRPEEFTILYRDEFSIMQPLTCNYVSNGQTRYTFSYKLDNDVINLSVFKSDGHLEINVRNAKLDIPMDLNLVEFQVQWRGKSFDEPEFYVEPPEAGIITGPEIVYENEEVVVEVLINEGYQIIDTQWLVYEQEMTYDGQLEKIDDTHYSFTMPIIDGEITRVEAGIYCEEIPVVEEFSIDYTAGEHVVDYITYASGNLPGDEAGFSLVQWEEGYDFSHITVYDITGDEPVELATYNVMQCILLDEWPRQILIKVEAKGEPVPPEPGKGDYYFTTTFNRYAIVHVMVKADGSDAVVVVDSMPRTIDIDDTYEEVLRAACTFRQDLIVEVEVVMNKPDYTVKSSKVKINGKEI